jgi:hypothetical protein
MKNSGVLKEHPPEEREAPLPVLIVLLSYCPAVSVLLNPCLVALEYLAVNKATRRISLMKLLCATSCAAFSSCPTIDNPEKDIRESASRLQPIARR